MDVALFQQKFICNIRQQASSCSFSIPYLHFENHQDQNIGLFFLRLSILKYISVHSWKPPYQVHTPFLKVTGNHFEFIWGNKKQTICLLENSENHSAEEYPQPCPSLTVTMCAIQFLYLSSYTIVFSFLLIPSWSLYKYMEFKKHYFWARYVLRATCSLHAADLDLVPVTAYGPLKYFQK